MKRTALIFLTVYIASLITLSEGVSEENEERARLFEQRGCGACHDRTKDQTIDGLGPSLKQIAEAYKGHEGDLTSFLKCESKPLVDETRFSIMHAQVVKVKHMSESELKALEKFIFHGE